MIDTIIIGLLVAATLCLFISLFLQDRSKRAIEDLKDYSFEQSQELYKLRERVMSLETLTGINAIDLSHTAELRQLSELTKKHIIHLYSEGKTPDDISIHANIPLETVQILVDEYIQNSVN